MKFYSLSNVPLSRDDLVIKSSPVSKAMATIVMYGIAGTCLVMAIRDIHPRGMTPGALYFFAVVLALTGIIPYKLFRASLNPANWLLRVTSSGVMLKYRAYENWRLPADDIQIAAFDYSEIASAKLVKEQRTTPSSSGHGGNVTCFITYIDISLVNHDTSAFETHLQAERKKQKDGMMIFLDYPVHVLPEGIIEIMWSSGIIPSAKKIVAILGRSIQILETEHRKTNLTYNRNLSQSEAQEKIVALAKSGEKMAAAKLAQRVHGFTLGEATTFVDNLP
jgi:hypothetical protein